MHLALLVLGVLSMAVALGAFKALTWRYAGLTGGCGDGLVPVKRLVVVAMVAIPVATVSMFLSSVVQ